MLDFVSVCYLACYLERFGWSGCHGVDADIAEDRRWFRGGRTGQAVVGFRPEGLLRQGHTHGSQGLWGSVPERWPQHQP